MKKSIITLASFFMILTAFAAGPSDEVLQNFNATFSNPEKVTWYDSGDFHQAYFVQSGISTRVRYDKKGNFISAIRYYEEQNLPIHIANQVKKNYSKFKIYGVTEVTSTETVNYVINLEDAKNWYIVQVLATGEMATVKKFKKA